MSGFRRRLVRAVLLVVQFPKTTLLVCGLVLAACVGLALLRLSISTDQNKLFSADVAFFRDYLEFVHKFPENEAIYVAVYPTNGDGPPPPEQRWTAAADAITARLKALDHYVRDVDSRVPLDELGTQGLLFENPTRLKDTFNEAKQFIPLVKLWGERPTLVTGLLGGTPMERFLSAVRTQTPDAGTASFLRLLGDSWANTLQSPADAPLVVGKQLPDLNTLDATDPGRLGYYYVNDELRPDHHLLLVRVYPQRDFTSLTAISETVEAIREAAKDEGKKFPEFTVGVTGRPALEADEMRTTDRDSHIAEAVALTVVFIGMALMFKSLWLALAAEIALAVGIGWTFGWATLSVGELNLLSIVFLIALIGIGMDYLVQILSRYRSESRRHTSPKAIWAKVFMHVSAPINTACLGAAGAFLVSVLTKFQGAADLGIIAGGGLLLCLISGYTVLPALLVLFPLKVKPLPPAARYKPPAAKQPLWWRMVTPALWCVLLLAGIPLGKKTHFNPDLIDLQAPELESVKLVKHMDTWSAVVLSKDADTLRKVRSAVEALPTVGGTDSVLSAQDNQQWLAAHAGEMPAVNWAEPAAVTPQTLGGLSTRLKSRVDAYAEAAGKAKPDDAHRLAAAAEALGHAKALLATDTGSPQAAQQAAQLSKWQQGFIDVLKTTVAQFHPGPLDMAKIPKSMRGHYVADDGTIALYIDPKEDLWKRANLERFVHSVEDAVTKLPGNTGDIRVTGIASNIYHSTADIERAFHKATLYALILIVTLVFLDLRSVRETVLAVSVLALGLPMLVVLMGLFGVDWNFANFFGLPILIGAGHEYGVFMVHRYKEVLHDPRRVWRGWDVSDRALLLCAFITSSSFGFFWALGHHEGLRSLGLVMCLGTACIYLATILVVRPLLLWWLDRRRGDESADGGWKMENGER